MKLIKPSFEITTPINGEQILKEIERAARTCYKSEDKIEYVIFKDKIVNILTPDVGIFTCKSARNLIPKLIARGHEAMLEFGGSITVLFTVDRGVSHELVRHRIASFAQESTRYCNYSNDENIVFIIPPWVNIPEGIFNDETDGTPAFVRDERNVGAYDWYYHMIDSEIRYKSLIDSGWSPQEARSFLPISLKTEINVSANIREWRHIFKLRTASGAHPQMREVMIPLLAEFKKQIPILFDDINP